jgi:predicted small secreted protein
MTRWTVIALGVACVALLAGCATVEGVGQDISGGARTVRGWF